MRLWDSLCDQVIHTIVRSPNNPPFPVSSILFDPDRIGEIAVAYGDGSVHVTRWRSASGVAPMVSKPLEYKAAYLVLDGTPLALSYGPGVKREVAGLGGVDWRSNSKRPPGNAPMAACFSSREEWNVAAFGMDDGECV